MKILPQAKIDEARELIVSASANLIKAHRIVQNAYGSHWVTFSIGMALSYIRDALLYVAQTKLPAKAKSPKLKRMEGMNRRDDSVRVQRLAVLMSADIVLSHWYGRYKVNAEARREPVMPFAVWLANAIRKNGGIPIDVVEGVKPCTP